MIAIIVIILDSILVLSENKLAELDTKSLLIVVFVLMILIILMVALTVQPRSTKNIPFKVPLVPLIPILSMLVNFYLMLKLSTTTWIRFTVWMAIGLAIYFFYGIWNSNERSRRFNSKNSAME